jgi:hypothetical protein
MSTTNEPSGELPLFDRSGGLAFLPADFPARGKAAVTEKLLT